MRVLPVMWRSARGANSRVSRMAVTILHHAAPFAAYDRDGVAVFVVLARQHPVNAVFGEEAGPLLQLALVERMDVVVVQPVERVQQVAVVEQAEIAGQGCRRHGHSPMIRR
jgi:hypothetical protein